jgi:hypothetical protein
MNKAKLDKKVAKVISILKKIEVDGETMEHIINEVGMSEQMLKQLKVTLKDNDAEPMWIGAEFPISDDNTAKVLIGLNLEDGDTFDYTTNASIKHNSENNPTDCPWSYSGGVYRVVKGAKSFVFDENHDIILDQEKYLAEKRVKDNEISKAIKAKEFELKSNIAKAMQELSTHWVNSEVTYTLDKDYPFGSSLDELCADVNAWVEDEDED